MLLPQQIEELLARDFKDFSGQDSDSIERLKGDASVRSLYRISSSSSTVVGVYGPNAAENDAFLSFTDTFLSLGLPAVKILYRNKNRHSYLLEDLGNTTLFQYLLKKREEAGEFPESELLPLYKQAVGNLAKFQILAASKIDYSKCFQTDTFERLAWQSDINYFLNLFVRQLIPGYEYFDSLNNELDSFLDKLEPFKAEFFIYRDFQSRNMMLTDQGLKFFDYQAGRKGYLSYDIASLLVDARADLPLCFRDKILEYYKKSVDELIPGKSLEISDSYPAFALIRVLQAMGSYGNNGIKHKKHEHLTSVPYALNNGLNLIESDPQLEKLVLLKDLFAEILTNRYWEKFLTKEK